MKKWKFHLTSRLGAGHFGEVWLVNDTSLNSERALKLVPLEKVPNPRNFFQEAQILKTVEHPNIVRVEEAGEAPDGRIYVAMEYLPKGSVEDEAKGAYLPLTRAKRLIIDVLRGMQDAHMQGITHRDIKPANILVGNRDEGKLSDFGLAIPVGFDFKAVGAKDYAYMLHLAPEVNTPNDYAVSTDIYACGMTLYRLVNGDSMLPSVPPKRAHTLAAEGKFPDREAYREFIPRPVRMIINKALNKDPSSRFSSADAMRHAIEQVTIEKNWNEKSTQNGTQWTCSWDCRCYEVSRSRQTHGRWDVTVRKGRTKKSLRRLSALCLEDAPRPVAERHTRRILQDFVLGKHR